LMRTRVRARLCARACLPFSSGAGRFDRKLALGRWPPALHVPYCPLVVSNCLQPCTSLHSSPCNLTASTQDTQSEQAPSESLNPVRSTRFTAAPSTRFTAAPSNFRDRLTSRYVVLLRVGSLQAAKSDGSLGCGVNAVEVVWLPPGPGRVGTGREGARSSHLKSCYRHQSLCRARPMNRSWRARYRRAASRPPSRRCAVASGLRAFKNGGQGQLVARGAG